MFTSHGVNANKRVDSLDGDKLAVGVVRVGVGVRRAIDRREAVDDVTRGERQRDVGKRSGTEADESIEGRGRSGVSSQSSNESEKTHRKAGLSLSYAEYPEAQ
jgi:hypothetical protein